MHSAKVLRQLLVKNASVTLDIEEGDTLLFGRYKNKPHEVEEIGTDENGQPTVNGMKLLACRIKKKMPGQSKKAQSAQLAMLQPSKPSQGYTGGLGSAPPALGAPSRAPAAAPATAPKKVPAPASQDPTFWDHLKSDFSDFANRNNEAGPERPTRAGGVTGFGQ